jgi:hypothetical protein
MLPPLSRREIEQKHAQLITAYHSLFQGIDWRWSLTLTIPRPLPLRKASTEIKNYLRQLERVVFQSVIAACGIVVAGIETTHAHLLLVERVHRYRTIEDIVKAECLWHPLHKTPKRQKRERQGDEILILDDCSVEIRDVHYQEGIISYLCDPVRNLRVERPDDFDLLEFRTTMLKQKSKTPCFCHQPLR